MLRREELKLQASLGYRARYNKHPSNNNTKKPPVLIITLTWYLEEEAFWDCLLDKMVLSVLFITITTTIIVLIWLMHFCGDFLAFLNIEI